VYYFITTCAVECYWHCSGETVHYKSDETLIFCGFRCATPSPITVFINFVFYIYFLVLLMPTLQKHMAHIVQCVIFLGSSDLSSCDAVHRECEFVLFIIAVEILNGFLLFDSFEAFGDPQPACAAVTGYVTDNDTTRLWQPNPFWCSWPPAEAAPDRSQCSRTLFVMRGNATTSLICFVTCTGCRFWREYTTDWPCLFSTVVTTWRLRTPRSDL